jgi:hypothetical protein
MNNIVRIGHELISWLHTAVSLAGVIVCLVHIGRSVWARVIAGAFAVEVLVSVVYHLASLLSLVTQGAGLNIVYLVASALGLVAAAALVVGLFGLLTQLAGVMDRGAPDAPPPSGEPVEPF